MAGSLQNLQFSRTSALHPSAQPRACTVGPAPADSIGNSVSPRVPGPFGYGLTGARPSEVAAFHVLRARTEPRAPMVSQSAGAQRTLNTYPFGTPELVRTDPRARSAQNACFSAVRPPDGGHIPEKLLPH
jgi:hypothetical protein